MRRRLAAILAADIVGYSRMMGRDEDGALAALRDFRSTALTPAVADRHGRIIKSMGDGWLVEFDSSTDAVACALALQESLKDNRLLRLRIGVHIGDIVHEDDDIFGDGVNIAARLQEVAVEGGIALSGSIYDSIDPTLGQDFSDAGPHALKNIARPVQVWMRGRANAPTARSAVLEGFPNITIRPCSRPEENAELADLADGIISEVAGSLAAADWLNARIRALPAPDDYVLDGALRARGDMIRLEMTLTAPSGEQAWRRSFDGALSDSFAWQDRASADIAADVFGCLFDSERERVLAVPMEELSAEDCLLAGVLEFFEVSESALESALACFKRATDRRPDFALAAERAAKCALAGFAAGCGPGLQASLAHIPEWLAASRPSAVIDLADTMWRRRSAPDDDALGAAAGRALAASPDDGDALYLAGWAYLWLGVPETAANCFRRFSRENRYSALTTAARAGLATAWAEAGRDLAAIENAEDVIAVSDDFAAPLRAKAAAAAHLGRMDEARQAVKAALRIDPGDSVARLRAAGGYGDAPAVQRFLDGLEKAGFPE